MDFRFGREFDFEPGGRVHGAARRPARATSRFPPGTLLEHQLPRRSPNELNGAEVTRLGKRIYRDTLELEEEDRERRAAPAPLSHLRRRRRPITRRRAPDFAAIDAGKISVTPLHFELTDVGRMEELRGWDLSSLIEPAAEEALATCTR